MTLSLKVLGSSSSGNCGLLLQQNKYYLIDAGFSCKRISQFLQAYHLTLNDLSGVFITHEHQDHTLGLKPLIKYSHLKFYTNSATAYAIEKKLNIKPNWEIFVSDCTFEVSRLLVTTFRIPHDAAEPVGYVFRTDNYSCAWVTDLGHITTKVAKAVMNTQEIVLESNHDEQLLREHPTRPAYIKERILGPLGHLSNNAAFEFIKNNHGSWKNICLAHLSRECNSYKKVKALFQPLANAHHFNLTIADPIL